MFVPVSCTSCGKPFQVPEAALGKLAPCPWCAATVTALPVSAPPADAGPAPVSAPVQKSPAPEPLSLDDAPAAPRPRASVATLAIGVAVLLAVMGATVLLLNFRSGRMSDAEWVEFTPADGSFTVALPGRATESEVEPVSDGSLLAGKRYAVRRWYARTSAWVAFNDLEPGLTKKLADDRTRVVAAGVLRVARDREVSRLRGTVTREAELRLGSGWGVEVYMDTPAGLSVARLVLLSEGPHPRLYVYGIQGKHAMPDGPAPHRLFASFRVNN